jgi:hypothetical protein
MRTLFLATLLASSPVLAEDALVATTDTNSGDLVVYKINASGISKLYTEKKTNPSQAGWSDAKTLWVLYNEKVTRLSKIVDGKVVEKITVPATAFKLPAGVEVEPKLHLGTKGEVYVHHCLKPKGETGDANLRCAKGVWVRVDTKDQKQQTKQPAIDEYRPSGSGLGTAPPFPKAKAPAGYTVTLQQVVVDGVGDDQKKMKTKGAVCKGPGGSKTWPDDTVDIPFAMKPSRVTWLRTSPPVVKIDGKATNPIGDVEQHEAVFFECKRLYEEAVYFGAGAWALRDQSQWTVYVDGKSVGSIASDQLRAAPIK